MWMGYMGEEMISLNLFGKQTVGTTKFELRRSLFANCPFSLSQILLFFLAVISIRAWYEVELVL